jgi:hypothetical protein
MLSSDLVRIGNLFPLSGQQITQKNLNIQGSPLPEAQQQAISWIGNQVNAQATYLGYADAFWALTLISLAAVPLALILRKVKLGGGPVPVE